MQYVYPFVRCYKSQELIESLRLQTPSRATLRTDEKLWGRILWFYCLAGELNGEVDGFEVKSARYK